MTTGLHGADTDALRAQTVALHDAAEALTACAQRTGQTLDAVAWRGADADRTRDEWHTQHARSLLTCSAAMNEAARRLLDEADAQDRASGVAGATSAAPATDSSGRTWAELRTSIDRGHDVAKEALGLLGLATLAADGAAMVGATWRWTNVTGTAPYRVLDQAFGIVQDAQIGPAVGGVLKGAAALGVASNAYGVYRSHTEGDLHGTVDNAVGAVLGAGSFIPGYGLASSALGASWTAGTTVGTYLNTEMQGTEFGDRFAARMDTAFEVGGAWGMLNTPGALIVTAGEEVGLAAGRAVGRCHRYEHRHRRPAALVPLAGARTWRPPEGRGAMDDDELWAPAPTRTTPADPSTWACPATRTCARSPAAGTASCTAHGRPPCTGTSPSRCCSRRTRPPSRGSPASSSSPCASAASTRTSSPSSTRAPPPRVTRASSWTSTTWDRCTTGCAGTVRCPSPRWSPQAPTSPTRSRSPTAQGVLHRDVKPQNVLLLPTSYVLTDFGIARMADAGHTASLERFSYRHASPQVLDGLEPAAADDVWSLGSTLHTLLDGRAPFASPDPADDTALGYLRRVRTGERRPLDRADVPDGLRTILDLCLAPAREDRYPSADDVHAALLALPTETRSWTPERTTTPTPAPVVPAPPVPASLVPAQGVVTSGVPAAGAPATHGLPGVELPPVQPEDDHVLAPLGAVAAGAPGRRRGRRRGHPPAPGAGRSDAPRRWARARPRAARSVGARRRPRRRVGAGGQRRRRGRHVLGVEPRAGDDDLGGSPAPPPSTSRPARPRHPPRARLCRARPRRRGAWRVC